MRPYYEHAGITIYHGDCRDVLTDVVADVLVTDPPYGISQSSNRGASWNGTTIANDHSTKARDEVLSLLNVPALVFGTWKSTVPVGAHTALVWDKGPASGMGNLSIPWKPSWELIYVIGEGFVGARDEGVIRGLTGITWESMGRAHPHEKPVRLMAYLLSKCPAGVVCDPFMGSGTTIRAAKDLGRRAIGIEIEERYCEIAAKRLSQEVLFPAGSPKAVPAEKPASTEGVSSEPVTVHGGTAKSVP